MTRFWLILVLWVLPVMGMTQDLEPRLSVEFETTEAIPGQFLTLRVSVLVPTHMPSPPEWPSFEAPNIVVRLPERASSPISERIERDTWAGISRRYQISPIVAGDFSIEGAVVRVTYADPVGGEPLMRELPLPEMSFSGVVPQKAQDLDPFVAATALSLEQTVEGDSKALEAGGSFSRVLTLKAEGLVSMFLPVLTPEDSPDGLRAYPESPVLQDSDNRGVTTGTRVEKTVFVAQGAVKGSLPEVTIRWYNVESETIEEASAPAIEVQANAPAGGGPLTSEDGAKISVFRLLAYAGAAVLLLVIGRTLWRWWPDLQAWQLRRRAQYEASERYAWKRLMQAITHQNLEACRRAYDIWQRRFGSVSVHHSEKISRCFVSLGQSRYSEALQSQKAQEWPALAKALRQARSARHDPHQHGATLPPLNP